jgi:nucleoid DNA-binding protein
MHVYKTDLMRTLAKKHRRTQAHYAAALTEIFDGIREELASGHSVSILEFGTFYSRPVKEQQIRNLRSAGTLTVPAHHRVGFRPGEKLRQVVARVGMHKAPARQRKQSALKRMLSLGKR